MEKYILELQNISKSFPGVKALDDINLKIKEGEIHALVGENGAGKSTLINIISGVFTQDSGNIIYDGEMIKKSDPWESINRGISTVHQELKMVDTLTVAENIFLGMPILKKSAVGGNVDQKKMQGEAKRILDSIGISIDPKEEVGGLSVAKKQIVEICKALQRNVKVLILDEPSATLTEKEIRVVFALLKNLTEKKITVIYISHRLEEIFEIADRVTVLRDGRTIITEDVKKFTRDSLIKYMVGREITNIYPTKNKRIGEVILEVKNLQNKNVHDINFSLKKGEILGITGLVGAGRTELVRAIFGADKIESGDIIVNSKKQKINDINKAVKLKFGLVPEERKVEGIIPVFSVANNISLVGIERITKKTFLNRSLEKNGAKEFIDKLRIVTPSGDTLVSSLSGGNQQKCVISKWLFIDSNIMIFDEPTRGIDVGAKQEIYRILIQLAEQGRAIIIVSSELPEVLGVCNRVLVMSGGKITAELDGDKATQEEILNYSIS
jgi:ribose transport system ATP-binding protein